MKKIILLFTVILFCSVYLNAQKGLLPGNFMVEFGGGTNNLSVEYNNRPVKDFNFDRTDYTFSAKIIYQYDFSERLAVLPFAGYNNFGGESRRDENNFEDEIKFHAAELGSFIQFDTHFYGMSLGIGFKGKYAFSKSYDWEGEIVEVYSQRFISESEFEDGFKDFSYDAGFRVEWKLFTTSLVLEGWFGLVDLVKEGNIHHIDSANESHLRLFIGFPL